MFLYRVESGAIEEYANGQIIEATGKYGQYLKDSQEVSFKSKIEDALQSAGVVDRKTVLFAFHELKDALIFSAKIYKGNARIYTISPEEIIYKGDMNVLDSLTTAIKIGLYEKDYELFSGFCSEYWKRGKTFSPCYEYLLRRAQIEKVLCNVEECKKFYQEYTNSKGQSYLSVERSSIYLQKINEVYAG